MESPETNLEQALTAFVEKLLDAGDLAIDQAPEVVRQMIMYDALMAWGHVALIPLYAAAFWLAASKAVHHFRIQHEITPAKDERYHRDEEARHQLARWVVCTCDPRWRTDHRRVHPVPSDGCSSHVVPQVVCGRKAGVDGDRMTPVERWGERPLVDLCVHRDVYRRWERVS